MILTRIGILSSSGSRTTPEQIITNNYISVVGASTPESDALLAFTDELVAANIYNKFLVIAPFIGNTLANKYINLVDPLDSNSAFRLKPIGSPTDHAKGVTLNGSSQQLVSFVDPANIQNREFIGSTWYAQRGIGANHITLKDENGANAAGGFSIEAKFGSNAFMSIWCSASGIPIASTHAGFNVGQRVTGGTVEYWQGTTKYSQTAAVNNYNSSNRFITIMGNGEGAYQLSYWAIHQALNSTEMAAYNTAVENLMTALSRNI